MKEVVRQVRNLLLSPYMEALCEKIHGKPLILTTVSATEISTNLAADNKGTSQLVACGVNGSLTGKHFDRIFTDDIVNVQDRISRAERDHTKQSIRSYRTSAIVADAFSTPERPGTRKTRFP